MILSASEIADLTGYARPAEQVAELHRLGFTRARIDRLGRVVLERAHYDAVCDGRFATNTSRGDNDRPRVVRVRAA